MVSYNFDAGYGMVSTSFNGTLVNSIKEGTLKGGETFTSTATSTATATAMWTAPQYAHILNTVRVAGQDSKPAVYPQGYGTLDLTLSATNTSLPEWYVFPDSVIATASVPEPSTLVMAAILFGMLGVFRIRMRLKKGKAVA